MKTYNVLNLVWLAILGAILIFSSPAYAAGDPLIDKARDQLHQALNPGGDPPSNADRTALLKSALALLQKSAPVYRGQRAKAIEDVKLALEALSKGDPDHKAKELIREALDYVRDIT
jgi:hypothetical protein